MIPIQDTIPARRFPLVNTLIIGLNILVFLFEISLGLQVQEQFIFNFGLIPAKFWVVEGVIRWIPVVTSIFLHGGWWHLISNMLALYIFGDNVEDRMGHGRYLVFYLLGGITAGLVHVWIHPTSPVPTVGASGAIAAVLGAYLLLYPLARIITLVPIPLFFFFPILEIPAIFYLVFWFLSQLFNGAFALTVRTYQGGGVAWWAHIGGFVTGVMLVHLFAKHRSPPRHPVRRQYFYPDEYRPW